MSDGCQQSLIRKAQILFLLIDKQQSVCISACGNKAGKNRIVCVVLCGLVNDIDRFCTLAVGKGHWLAPCQNCGKLQNQGAFAVTGVALQDRDLAIRNIRIPQPFHTLYLNLACLCNLKLHFFVFSPFSKISGIRLPAPESSACSLSDISCKARYR